MIYPSVVKNYKVYNDQNGEFVGLSDIVLPKLVFEKNDIKGAGIGGSFNLPVSGNVMPMTTTMSFHTNTLQCVTLFSGNSGRIKCQSSLQGWDTSKSKYVELPEEVIMTIVSDEYDLGKRDASTKAVITETFSVLYLALYFNSQVYWQIDPFNNITIVNGQDLNAQTRINIMP